MFSPGDVTGLEIKWSACVYLLSLTWIVEQHGPDTVIFHCYCWTFYSSSGVCAI